MLRPHRADRPPAEVVVRAPGDGPTVPILRILDRAKALEFYVDYLGFHLDWEHGGPADHSPLYAQVSRGGLRRHDDDCARPGIRDEDWGRVMVVVDPFRNRIVFHQPVAGARVGRIRPAHRRVVALRLRP